jgi:periplasmic protein CpxP/Spy
MLEQMLRQRWMAVVQTRLQLSDAQVARLKETNRHFSTQRNQLNQAERGVRQEMRSQLTGATTADDKRLAVLIDSLLDIQRQRLEILRDEQHELSLFMTPLQRVRYLALQEQLRQRIEMLRQRAGGRIAGRPGPEPPDTADF